MLHLLGSWAFCFWCAVMLRHRAVADEEAPWGPTPSRETSSWWPKPPPLSSFPFRVPFLGMSAADGDGAGLVTTTKGLPSITINAHLFVSSQTSSNHFGNSKERLLEPPGSGDGSSFEASEASDSTPQPPRVTSAGSESRPTEMSDFPPSSNGSRAPDSFTPTSASVGKWLFSTIPTSAGSPGHTRLPWGTTLAAGSSTGAAQQHLPGDITQRIYSTVPLETTVPTALTWAEAHTTTIPGLVQGPTGQPAPVSVTPPESPRSSEESLQYSSAPDITASAIHTPWAVSDPRVAEAVSGREEERPGLIASSARMDGKAGLKFLTSTAPSKRVKVPIARGRQRRNAASTSRIQSIDAINQEQSDLQGSIDVCRHVASVGRTNS